MIPPNPYKKYFDEAERKKINTPEEMEYYMKQRATLEEMARRQNHARRIKAGDLVSYKKSGGQQTFVGLVVETKVEEELQAYDGSMAQTKYARVHWSQEIPDELGIPSNEHWWFNLKAGLWKLINR